MLTLKVIIPPISLISLISLCPMPHAPCPMPDSPYKTNTVDV
ncbi:MAG: hypothetical protein RMY29_027455 [Nostoc sp. CreGUA01]|nr:hypothetical protein [Nostoc sp. CreGUA01]